MCKAYVLQNSCGQLTGTSRTSILAAAIAYANTNSNTNPYALRRPLSNTSYIAYKKACVLAASQPGVRPQQTAIITELQALGVPKA